MYGSSSDSEPCHFIINDIFISLYACDEQSDVEEMLNSMNSESC